MVLIITATFMLIVITTTICSGMLSTADGKARARGKAQFLTEWLGVFATERGSEDFACVCVRAWELLLVLRLCCKASPQELSTSVGLDDRTPHLLNASCQHLKNTRLSVVFRSELKCDLMSRFHDELGLRSPIWSLTR